MYCKKCGREQKDGQRFCPKCGTPFAVIEEVESEPLSSDEGLEYNTDEEVEYTSDEVEDTLQDTPPDRTFRLLSCKSGRKWIAGAAALVFVALCVFLGWKQVHDSGVSLFSLTEVDSDVDCIPFKSTAKGRWGMLNPDGTILFEEEFKDIPTIGREGRFMVRNGNGLWEVFTATESPEKVGDEYVYIGNFFDGVAPAVRKNERISLIDKNGEVVKVLDKSGSKNIVSMENFHYGYALIHTDDAVGIINTKGEELLEARKYCRLLHVAPKRFLALNVKYKDGDDEHNVVFDVIDPRGNVKNTIRMAKYDDIFVMGDGYIGIEQTSDGEKLYGIMNLDGDVIVRPTSKIKGIQDFRNDKYIFSNGEYLGVRTVKDEVLIRAKYDGIMWATDNLLWVNSSDEGKQEWTLINLDGEKITKESYQNVLPFYDGKHAFVQITDKTWGVVDYDGEEQKNAPDIFAIRTHDADFRIYSDYLDIEAIAAAVGMTPEGFGGFGISMSPIRLIKVYNENCSPGSRLELNPNATRTDKLTYQKEVMDGVRMEVKLYYSAYITKKGDSHYDEAVGEWITAPDTWTDEYPQYIRMSVSGSKLNTKTNLLYKKLAVKAKSYGSVYKENDHACIVIQKSRQGMILVDTGSEVWGIVKSAESLIHESIEQYSANKTQTIMQPYLDEEVDSIPYVE